MEGLTFDRLRLVVPLSSDAIEIVDKSRYEVRYVNGVETNSILRDDFHGLNINLDKETDNVTIEFTSKILRHNYPRLISLSTINRCFDSIQEIGCCKLNLPLCKNSTVVGCDVCTDLSCSFKDEVRQYLTAHISNNKKITARIVHKNQNVIISKNVTSRSRQVHLTVYDKGLEMKKALNIRYAQTYGIPVDYFEGVLRFEMRLNSQLQIKRLFGVDDCSLMTVMNPRCYPIAVFMKDVINIPTTRSDVVPEQISSTKLLLKFALLEHFNWDMRPLETWLRRAYAKGTSIRHLLESYQKIFDIVRQGDSLCKPAEWLQENIFNKNYWVPIPVNLVDGVDADASIESSESDTAVLVSPPNIQWDERS